MNELEQRADEYKESKRHRCFRANVGTVQIDYEKYLDNLKQAYIAGATEETKLLVEENRKAREIIKKHPNWKGRSKVICSQISKKKNPYFYACTHTQLVELISDF